MDGLTLAPLRPHYVVKYKNSLVGKHFKGIQQLGIFHLYNDLCPEPLFNLWRANSELGALLWYHEIEDMDTYTVRFIII